MQQAKHVLLMNHPNWNFDNTSFQQIHFYKDCTCTRIGFCVYQIKSRVQTAVKDNQFYVSSVMKNSIVFCLECWYFYNFKRFGIKYQAQFYKHKTKMFLFPQILKSESLIKVGVIKIVWLMGCRSEIFKFLPRYNCPILNSKLIFKNDEFRCLKSFKSKIAYVT